MTASSVNIAGLPSVIALDGDELVPLVQNGVTKKSTLDEITQFVATGNLVGTDIITPAQFHFGPNTGVDVTTIFQTMLTAATGKTLWLPAGRYILTRALTGPANIKWIMHPGTILDFTTAPNGTLFFTFAGSLSSQFALSQTSYLIGPAGVWVASTNTVPKTYNVNDRVSVSGINWRCIVGNTAANSSLFPSTQAAFNSDVLAGFWERSNLTTTADISSIATNDWLVVQSSQRFDAYSYLNVIGEATQVFGISGGTINTRGIFHYNYNLSDAPFFRKINTVKDIHIFGGQIIGRKDNETSINGQQAFFFNCCENVKVEQVDISQVVTCIGMRDTINARVMDCTFRNGQGLAYGVALSDACQDIQIIASRSNYLRHFFTASAEPNRSGPLHCGIENCIVDVSRPYLTNPALPTSPFGGTGDAIDVHPGCDYISFINNKVFNASGSGLHLECPNYRLIGNEVDGCDYGTTCTNNTLVGGSVEIRGNTFRQCSSNGISVRQATLSTGPFNRVIIENNTVDGSGGIGINVQGLAGLHLTNVQITGNTVLNSQTGSYSVFCFYVDEITISDNTITTTLATQNNIGIENYDRGIIANNMLVQPAGATGDAISLSNANCAAGLAGRTTNVGNGTVILGDPAVLPGTPDGNYIAKCTGSGVFTLFNLDGSTVGLVTVGVEWTGPLLDFTITAGSIPYTIGDGWLFVVNGTSVSFTKNAVNTGNTTLTVPTFTTIPDAYLNGTWPIQCTSIAGGAGNETWQVSDPNGVVLGTATTGVQFFLAGVLLFRIKAGTIAAAVGDTINFTAARMSNGMRILGNVVKTPSPLVGQNGVIGADQCKNTFISNTNDFTNCFAAYSIGNGPGHIIELPPTVSSYTTNSSMTWKVSPLPTNTLTASTPLVLFNAPISVDRTATVLTDNATDGMRVKFRNVNTAPHVWSVAKGLLSLSSAQNGEIVYAGTPAIASGTYNSGTGAVALAMASNIGFAATDIIYLSQLTGTGAFTSLQGAYIPTSASGTSVNYTAPSGLGATTILGGLLAVALSPPTVTSGTYDPATGTVVLSMVTASGFSLNNQLLVAGLTGTGAVSSLTGLWIVAAVSLGSATVTYFGTSGLTATTITGGFADVYLNEHTGFWNVS